MTIQRSSKNAPRDAIAFRKPVRAFAPPKIPRNPKYVDVDVLEHFAPIINFVESARWSREQKLYLLYKLSRDIAKLVSEHTEARRRVAEIRARLDAYREVDPTEYGRSLHVDDYRRIHAARARAGRKNLPTAKRLEAIDYVEKTLGALPSELAALRAELEARSEREPESPGALLEDEED